jgi:hypothetical protein
VLRPLHVRFRCPLRPSPAAQCLLDACWRHSAYPPRVRCCLSPTIISHALLRNECSPPAAQVEGCELPQRVGQVLQHRRVYALRGGGAPQV